MNRVRDRDQTHRLQEADCIKEHVFSHLSYVQWRLIRQFDPERKRQMDRIYFDQLRRLDAEGIRLLR